MNTKVGAMILSEFVKNSKSKLIVRFSQINSDYVLNKMEKLMKTFLIVYKSYWINFN